MGDISNKTLAILVGVAIVVSLVGLLSVGKGGVVYISGRAGSGEGPVSLNLTSEVSIKVENAIDFGNGRVWANSTNATLDSDAGTVQWGTWAAGKKYIKVENDGTVNISVNVTADQNAATFIGGTNPSFKLKAVETETGACAGTLVTTYTDVPDGTEDPINICDLLMYGLGEDEFNVSVRLVVPSDAPAGQRNTTLTFSAVQA